MFPNQRRTALGIALALPLTALGQTTGANSIAVDLLMDLDLGYAKADQESPRAFSTSLSAAEIDLAVQPTPHWATHIAVANESGTMRADQAWAAWDDDALGASFGLMPLDHGLFAAHLVVDPWLQREAETILPALAIRGTVGLIRGAMAVASRTTEVDSGGSVSEVQAFPTLDLAWSEEGLVRLSGRIGEHSRDIDLALRIPVGNAAIDLEGILLDGPDLEVDAAYLTGVAWRVHPPLEFAVRFDGRRDIDGVWDHRFHIGATAIVAEIARAGIEWMQEPGEGGEPIARVGIQTHWQSRLN